MKGRVTAWLLLVAWALASGCSSFHRDWQRAMAQPVPVDDITGAWEGRWLSHANGHRGPLRAVIERLDTNTCRVQFRAHYNLIAGKWLPVRYSYAVERLETMRDEKGLVKFRGAENLGCLAGGVYEYNGAANTTNFFARYRSKYDRGIFEMTRPAREVKDR
jgi:hypothetical protein